MALTEHIDDDSLFRLFPGAGRVAIQDRVLGDIGDQVLCPLRLLLQNLLVQEGLQTFDQRVGTVASTVDLIGISELHCLLLRRRLLTRPWKTGNTGHQTSPPPCPVKLPTMRSLIKEEEPKKKGQGWFCSSTRDPRSGLRALHLDQGGWPRAVTLLWWPFLQPITPRLVFLLHILSLHGEGSYWTFKARA